MPSTANEACVPASAAEFQVALYSGGSVLAPAIVCTSQAKRAATSCAGKRRITQENVFERAQEATLKIGTRSNPARSGARQPKDGTCETHCLARALPPVLLFRLVRVLAITNNSICNDLLPRIIRQSKNVSHKCKRHIIHCARVLVYPKMYVIQKVEML